MMMLVMLTSMVRIHIIFDSRGGYDVDGSNDDDGNGHHDKDVDGVDDLGCVGGSDFPTVEMKESMVPITLSNRL